MHELTLIIEPIYPIDRRAFMITTQQEEVLWVLDLVRQQQAYSLETLLATVDIVTQEQIISLGWKATVLKQPQQIRVLAVYIAAYLQRCFQLEQNGLLQEYFPRLETETSYFCLRHLYGLAGSTSPD